MQRPSIVRVDLEENLKRYDRGILLACADAVANRMGAEVYQAGTAASLAGYTAVGYFVRPDGATIMLDGSIEDNVAYVDLPESCYRYDGSFTFTLKLCKDGIKQTLVIFDGRIAATATDDYVESEKVISLTETWALTHYTYVNRLYVDIQNGSDELGNGTKAKPYKTLEKLFLDANTTSTDVRCYLVSAGDYHVAKSVVNALTIHITALVEGVNLIFDSNHLAFYNCHLNICGEADNYINVYGHFYVEGGTAAFDYCNFHARIGSYFSRMSYANCTIFDPPEGAANILWNYGSNVVLSTITMSNTRNDLTVFDFDQCTALITGSWTENNTTDAANESCFANFSYSFACILSTKRSLTNNYTYNLRCYLSQIVFRSETFYTSWKSRCVNGDFLMPYAGLITYQGLQPITITTTDADGTAHSYAVMGKEL